MNWTYDGLHGCHVLTTGDGTVAARIYESEKQKVRQPFRARSLISVFLLSERRFNAAARRNKEWVSTRRAFATAEDRKGYLERRKAEIGRFVKSRQQG